MSSIFGRFLTILGLKRREANVLVVGLDNSGKSTILNYLKRKEDQVEEIVPTVGYTVEKLSGIERNRSGINLTAFDMSGQGRYRNLWEHYYDSVEGIIFVVDSTDALRLVVARDELEMLLKHQDIIDQQGLQDDGDQNIDGEASTASENVLSSQDDHHLPLQSPTIADTINGSTSAKSGDKNDQKKRDIPILFFANKMDLKEAIPTVKISQTLGLHQLPHRQWHVQASNALNGDGIQEGIDWFLVQIANNKKLQQQNGGSGNGKNS